MTKWAPMLAAGLVAGFLAMTTTTAAAEPGENLMYDAREQAIRSPVREGVPPGIDPQAIVDRPRPSAIQAGVPRPPDRAAQMVVDKTGQLGAVVSSAGLDRGGQTIKGAKGLRTWAQIDGSSLRLIAELPTGVSEGTFPDLIPEDWTMAKDADGTIVIRDVDGRTQGRLQAPWAIDATGKSLPTHFLIQGRSLRQIVDTKGAVYPVVMDPWVQAGWWFYTPVYYVEFSWSETWSLKNSLDKDSSNIPGLFCGFIPTATAKITCGTIWLLVKADVKTTVNTAIRASKCYKMRMPASGGAVSLPAYDSYYVTCRS